MESRQNMNAPGGEHNLVMKPIDRRDRANSSNDIMTRRLKNRERQRRYRARKRLEADMKNACTLNNPNPSQVEMRVNEIPHNFITSIHCRRDWKKDARRAHVVREQVISLDDNLASFAPANESQATLLPSGAEAKPPIETESSIQDSSERRFTPGRRHWKADARKKKN